MTFGSTSIMLHLLRGCVGFGALATIAMAPISPWWSVGLVPLALISLKGCPACWTMGLIETVAQSIKPRRAPAGPLLPDAP